MTNIDVFLLYFVVLAIIWLWAAWRYRVIYECTLQAPDTMWNILSHVVSYLSLILALVLALVLALTPGIAALRRRLLRHLGDCLVSGCHDLLSLFSWTVQKVIANRERLMIIAAPYVCMHASRLFLSTTAGVETSIFYTCYLLSLWFQKSDATCCHQLPVKREFKEEEEKKPVVTYDITGNIC